MSNLLKILQNKDVPIENQQILDYLQSQLNADVQHQLEEAEQGDAMMQDALDGLRLVEDKSRLDKMTRDINQHLQQRIAEQRSRRKETARWKDQSWIMMAAITLLVLIVICFVIVYKLRHHHG
jgi:hypothetical protein